jgi:hypothetical protein
MTNIENELLSLISEYITTANYYCNTMQKYFNVEDLLLGWKSKKIQSEGEIEKFNIKYHFHGVGCLFEKFDFLIDIDFGSEGTCGGFDLWKLKKFLKNKSINEKYNVFMDENRLEETFNLLVKDKIIFCPKTYPSPHLFYINK